ncbi:MAG: hypothetical protein LBT27_04685, partial [Prevotellaceae bacterium]|nr:hypothetical protein [Prevotellaceae bacterium]
MIKSLKINRSKNRGAKNREKHHSIYASPGCALAMANTARSTNKKAQLFGLRFFTIFSIIFYCSVPASA